APYTAERIGMLAMLCVVVVFGVHSLADWTWYVPGDACVALLCAGWLAGRGPLLADAGGGARDTISFAAVGDASSAPAGSRDPLGGERPRSGLWLPDVRELRARLQPRALGPVRIAIA